MKKLLASVALVSAVAISLTACGGSKSDPVADTAKTSIAKKLTTDATTAADPFKDGSVASCMANGLVSNIGVKALQTYGIIDAKGEAVPTTSTTATRPNKADATTYVDTYFSCAGGDKIDAMMVAGIATAQRATTAAQKACVAAAIPTATARTILITEIQGDTASAEATALSTSLQTKIKACVGKK